MKFFTYTGTQHAVQNMRRACIVCLILTAYMFVWGPRQIATAETVHIPDPTLRVALELALEKKSGDPITQADMASLQVLQASAYRFLPLSETVPDVPSRWVRQSTSNALETPIRNLKGLEFAINLRALHLARNRIIDLTPLKKLTKLTYLDVGFNWHDSDLSPLKDLTNLTHLYLRLNRISDISALSNLTNLIELDLFWNKISDASPLKDLTNLTSLDLGHNRLAEVSILRSLTKLTILNLRENEISDVSPLKDLTNLVQLYLRINQLFDVSPPQKLDKTGTLGF